ncbi:hypothetical protein [Arthrobacter sp. efr-133-TYG-104]|uniref:hypothetical protein n=1 Tax=Arthrobacter sp. efr-133-TYG-104 TaxID=3040324 RepID=UPI00254DA1EF|nr:hypothetical protein [Arthrobacter sp. efr-133-TYG-104]
MTEPTHRLASEADNDQVEPARTQLDRVHPDGDSPQPESTPIQWPDTPVPTGDALVDRALDALGRINVVPVGEHGDLYGHIHDSLSEALDSEPGLPPVSPRNTNSSGSEGDS